MTVQLFSNSNIDNSITAVQKSSVKVNFCGRIVAWIKGVFSSIAEFFRRYMSTDRTWYKFFPEGKVDIYNFSGGQVDKDKWKLECSKMLLTNTILEPIMLNGGTKGIFNVPHQFAIDIKRASHISINGTVYKRSGNIKVLEEVYLHMQKLLGESAAIAAARVLHQGGFAITSVEFNGFLNKHYLRNLNPHTENLYKQTQMNRCELIRNADTVTINMKYVFTFRLGNRTDNCFVAVGSKFILPHELLTKIGEQDHTICQKEVEKQVIVKGYYSKACSSEEDAMNDLIGKM